MRKSTLPLLISLGLLMAGLLIAHPAQAQATAVPLPTPRADGAVVHVVGATLWVIAIRYAAALEMTAGRSTALHCGIEQQPDLPQSWR